MRALLQRVLEAKVVVDGQTTGKIEHGILVFLGIGKNDNLDIGKKLIDKILKYRFFDDEDGKMGWNISQANGGLLLVSQFTLMAQTAFSHITVTTRMDFTGRKRNMATNQTTDVLLGQSAHSH